MPRRLSENSLSIGRARLADSRIADFAAWVWRGMVAFGRALNHALAATPPLETDGFAWPPDDTVFQPRDACPAGKASPRERR